MRSPTGSVPPQKAYGKVLAYLRNNGFTLVEQSENRLTVTVRGTRTQAERTFNLRLHDYQIGRRSFYANDQDPGLPPELASHVQSVAGLANLAKPRNGIIKAIGKFLCSFNSFCTSVPGYIDQDAVKRCETNVNNALASNWGALIHDIDQILKSNCPPQSLRQRPR
ncbi:MAG TPA: protease pro-enzyme activation domain-containing protein [Candidatus Binataceae bacterium]|nr:protease pro-enzyme activation domain-containing protein [Candidatus Binataceae bacterium]